MIHEAAFCEGNVLLLYICTRLLELLHSLEGAVFIKWRGCDSVDNVMLRNKFDFCLFMRS